MPYNPDANGDDFVGVDDVLGVLGVYDFALMQPDLTCDYERLYGISNNWSSEAFYNEQNSSWNALTPVRYVEYLYSR